MIYNYEIVPTETAFGHVVAKTNPGVAFHWGHQKELLNYLKVGKSYSQINAFNDTEMVENWKQYPLVWLVAPTMTFSTVDPGLYSVPNARLVIALNNPNLSHLNDRREKESFPILEPIANNLLKYWKRAQTVRFENQQNPIFGFSKVPNYSTSDFKENEALDIWDAIVIEAKLIINTNCLNLEPYKNSGCREN